MLLNLHIKNLALIDEIDIDFQENLNILTGETGAGKSIIIDSIMMALGSKVQKDFVRKDAEYGLVELLFHVEDEETICRLKELEVSGLEEGELIISRKIMGNRSVNKVNGETVTLSTLRDVAALLLDLHAQHEHQSLLVPANHLMLLDRFGHETLEPLKNQVSELFKQYSIMKSLLAENTINETEKRRQLDLMEFERNEITSASLQVGEDDDLEEEYRVMSNSKQITESVTNAYRYVNDSAYDDLNRAIREMRVVTEYDTDLESMAEVLTTISDLMSDYGRSARNYLDSHSFSDQDFFQVEERLNTINRLKSKYGKTIQQVLLYADELEASYEKLLHQEEYRKDLEHQMKDLYSKLLQASNLLSEERKSIATKLSKNIHSALLDLNFNDVKFDMVFEEKQQCTADGMDFPYFIISTNPGEEMKPLWQVASGGELSRIMLAIKSCLADSDKIETLIFDEIDVGISGRTAQMVGEKIHGIGRKHQVICITHLPQIASMADHHYLIEKQITEGKTITSIEHLNKEQEIMELARLIGGLTITDTVINSAKEMKELVFKGKVD